LAAASSFGLENSGETKKSGQQTPRRWGWGTPLKKRAATRMSQSYNAVTFCQLPFGQLFWGLIRLGIQLD
jgi:hypothetical protein